MSHPFAPQSHYLFRRARLHAPAPPRMSGYGGFGGVGGKAAAYTHGIFDHGYALPPYVELEPTGLDGFAEFQSGYGRYSSFGQIVEVKGTVGACGANAYRQAFIDGLWKALPDVARTVGDAVGLKGALDSALKGLQATVFENLLDAADKGAAAFKSAFATYVAKPLESAAADKGVPLSASTIANIVADRVYAWSQKFLAACLPPAASTVPPEALPAPPTIPTATLETLKTATQKLPLMVSSGGMITSYDTGVTTYPVAAPSKAPLLIGAAAIAALMLLR